MKYWLLKTEPNEWSWKHQVESGTKGAVWDGVRNYQARNNLKTMKTIVKIIHNEQHVKSICKANENHMNIICK